METVTVNFKDIKDNNYILSPKYYIKKEVKKVNSLKYIKVRNFEDVKNQFIISTNKGTYFQSYNSIIAYKTKGKTYLDENTWDYSVTTGRYRNQFLHETKKETEKKIASGEYILTDLNK